MMNQELRHEYLKAIKNKDDNLTILKERYREEKHKVSLTAVNDVQTDFKTLLEKAEKMGVEAIERAMANTANRAPMQMGGRMNSKVQFAD